MSLGIAKSGLTLAAIAAICAALVAVTYHLTRDRIAANQQAMLEQSLAPALAGLEFEGPISESRLVIPPPHDLPGPGPAIVYRVFASGKPLAALIAVTAPNGYAGPIRILVGISYEGNVTGVRILEHRETPGLGDGIESTRSDWVYQFDGRSLGDPALAGWALKRDGGVFDQLSGASVTPRAVLQAIRETLLYFDAHREALFAAPASEDDK
ncbi:MAG TPA: electron transport complex subunit RsxG [Woeseiaceae bacterium]|nr:electron transport complex subunit RsxG [Woeseiaceae bacterium]